MTSGTPDEPTCTVIVTVDGAPAVLREMAEHASVGVTRFREWPGFLGGRLYRSDDETRLVQHLRWTSEAAYVRCRDDPIWDDLPSTRRFMDHVRAGRAHVDARTYTVAATGEGAFPVAEDR